MLGKTKMQKSPTAPAVIKRPSFKIDGKNVWADVEPMMANALLKR